MPHSEVIEFSPIERSSVLTIALRWRDADGEHELPVPNGQARRLYDLLHDWFEGPA